MSKRFAGLAAVDDVSLDIAAGSIVGLIGPNGAGKTTLFNLISGFSKVTSGSIYWQGADITDVSAADRVRLGFTRTFQLARVFGQLSVRDNVRAACYTATKPSSFLGDLVGTRKARAVEAELTEKADVLLEKFAFGDHADRRAGELPYGLTKRLGLLIGAATQPQMLMLDEPAAGLNHEEVSGLRDDLLRLQETGVTVLLIEHNMGLIMTVSESVVVLDVGKKIAEGSSVEVSSDPRVISAYLGG